MSEQNILNPTADSELNPDWGYEVDDTDVEGDFEGEGAKPHSRLLAGGGRLFQLGWEGRPKAIAQALENWYRQYRRDFFSYYDIDNGRYYSGRFVGGFKRSPKGNEQQSVTLTFKEMQGLPLYTYPDPSGAPWYGVDFDSRNSLGDDSVKLTGTWTLDSNDYGRGTYRSYWSQTLNDIAEFEYFGYGFGLWWHTSIGQGQGEVYLDGVSLGAIDQYHNPGQNAALQFTAQNVMLGWHRVKVRVNHSKAGGSFGYGVWVEAFRVVR